MGYRKAVSRYAIYITLLQLLQMLVGMFVTIKAVMYQAAGHECSVNKTNSVLGLTMYFSYFVLFFKLFIENYVTQTRKRAPVEQLPVKRKTLAEITNDVSRKVTSQILPQMDDEEESSDDANKPKKKMN